MHCRVSILLLLASVNCIVWPVASSLYYGAYEDPDGFDEYRCPEVADIKDDIRALKSMVEGLRQKLDPDYKAAVTEDHKDAVQCSEGFEYLPETSACYKVIMEKHQWLSAKGQCQSLNPNAHLISIESQEEHEAVSKYLNKQFTNRRAKFRCHRTGHAFGSTAFWTSGQRVNASDCSSEFVWKTTAGGMTALNYTQWADGEPNCWGGVEKCAELYLNVNFFWNDVPCEQRLCPICEYALRSGASTENPGSLVEQTEAPDESSGFLEKV